jgi:hypothetical protein
MIDEATSQDVLRFASAHTGISSPLVVMSSLANGGVSTFAERLEVATGAGSAAAAAAAAATSAAEPDHEVLDRTGCDRIEYFAPMAEYRPWQQVQMEAEYRLRLWQQERVDQIEASTPSMPMHTQSAFPEQMPLPDVPQHAMRTYFCCFCHFSDFYSLSLTFTV